MSPLTVRLLLTLLLGVDWAADPAQLPPAVRALARRNGSTVCLRQLPTCHTAAPGRTCLAVPLPHGGLPPLHPAAGSTPRPWPAPRTVPDGGLLYFLVSLQL
jgi:hypothetical protein